MGDGMGSERSRLVSCSSAIYSSYIDAANPLVSSMIKPSTLMMPVLDVMQCYVQVTTLSPLQRHLPRGTRRI